MHTASTTTRTPSPQIPPQTLLIRLLLWEQRSYRHPRFWIRVRLACAIWNLVLGSVLLSSGQWIGQYAWLGLISLAGSALLFVTVAHLRHYIRNYPSQG